MLNSLIEKLKEVKDFSKSQGRRHELWVVLMVDYRNLSILFSDR